MNTNHFLFASVSIFLALLFFSCSSASDEDSPPMSYWPICAFLDGSCINNYSTAESCVNRGGIPRRDCPSSAEPPVSVVTGSFTDPRDGQIYGTVAIGSQTWLAKNLNYDASGSVCNENQNSYCDTYGRLYDWATAMALPASCNSSTCSGQIQSKHRGVCPEGWHVPSNAEWDALYHYADGTNNTGDLYDSPTAGRYLKATSGWSSGGNGQDIYGFAALPGGYGNSGGSFFNVGDNGYWWSASENGSNIAYSRYMYFNNEYANWINDAKYYLHSVRCAQD